MTTTRTLVPLFVPALLLLCGCSDDPPEPPADALTLLNRGVLEMDRREFQRAIATFGTATEQAPESVASWVNLGLAYMNTGLPKNYPAADNAYRKALELDPGNLHATYSLGILLLQTGRMEAAGELFEAVLARDPDDWGASYNLAKIRMGQGRLEDAERLLHRALDAEPHLSSALFNLNSILVRQGRREERGAVLEAYRELQRTGTGRTFEIRYNEMGRYAQALRTPDVEDAADDAPAPPPAPRYRETSAAPVHDGIPGDWRPASVTIPAGRLPAEILATTFAAAFGPGAALADADGDGDLDLYLADGATAGRLLLNDGGSFREAPDALDAAGTHRSVAGTFGDIDDDGDADLYIACAGPNLLLRNDGGRFTDVTEAAGASGGDVFTAQAVLADLDADADLDVYLANLVRLDGPAVDRERRFPADFPGAPNVLLNNDRDGTFTDITERAGAGGGVRRSVAVVASDLDRDADADLLVVNDGQPDEVLRNDRIWRFRPVGADWGLADGGRGTGAVAADVDRDGLPDVLLLRSAGEPPLLLRSGPGPSFQAAGPWTRALAAHAAPTGAILDANEDGVADVVLAGGARPLLLLGTAGGELVAADTPLGALEGGWIRSVLPADVNGDGTPDLVASRTDAPHVVLTAAPVTGQHRLVLGLDGEVEDGYTRANTGGVGAIVEVVSGPHHQFQELLTTAGVLGGPPPCLHFGLGPRTTVDYVRIRWPDDVIQAEPGPPVDQPKLTITEVQRKSSSCPILFTWDGSRWTYVTDFLGTGGLGFFLEPGVYAPPDPTELVRVPVLEPRDGAWELRIHEPMEEILYLDEARLLVVDHPEGTEVHPDERLAVNGPQPDGRLVCTRTDGRHHPKTLWTREGPADVGLVTRADRRYQPGVSRDPRFLGYAEPQEIVLDFGDVLRRPAGERPLVLFIEGWVEYPYSHVNFAAWQAGLTFEALSIDVEVSPGSWETACDEFGYPAGLPRVMTLDVSHLRRDGTGRIRLRTNIELYLDAVWLAEDLGPDVLRVRDLAAESAVLRPSGYPREYSPDGELPLLYDYALMDRAIEYKAMEGSYTRFGDVTPLVERADDRYVIMGRAEEVVLRYPLLPPPEGGKERSFVLASFGWCKDMDLYTAHPHTVGPLPFRGMSDYPPPPGEHYPDTEATRRYRLHYNTRWLHGTR